MERPDEKWKDQRRIPILTPWRMEPGGLMPHSQGLSNKSLPWTESTQFPVLIPNSLRSILILSSCLRLGLPNSLFPVGLPDKIFGIPIFFLSGYITCPSQSFRLNNPDYIRRTVQNMKVLIVESSPLSILIPLGPKYSPQDPIFKFPWLAFLL
jgi:hypothetical protein